MSKYFSNEIVRLEANLLIKINKEFDLEELKYQYIDNNANDFNNFLELTGVRNFDYYIEDNFQDFISFLVTEGYISFAPKIRNFV